MQPIHFAAFNGHMDVINTLVSKHGVDLNSGVSYVHSRLESIMLLKLPIMLLSTALKSSLLCSKLCLTIKIMLCNI